MNRRTSHIPIFALAAVLLLATTSVHAAPLVTWNFGTTTGNFSALTPEQIAAGLAPSTVAEGISASSVSLFDDSTAAFSTASSGGISGGAMFSTRPWNASANNYIAFTVSAEEPGEFLNISAIQFYNRANVTLNFTDWVLYSDLDDYATPLGSGPINLSATLAFQSASLSLTEITTVTFHLVATGNPTTASFWHIDDLSVVGEVIPEPSSIALLAVGLGMLVWRKRMTRIHRAAQTA